MSEVFKVNWKKIREQAPYPPAAYDFVREGLAHTVNMVHTGNLAAADDDSRHVSGQQLCLGLRDYAIKQYGMLAKTVLNRWGVTRTDDFGNIVFAMIDAGLMRKTDDDHVEDFRAVFDFDEAFSAMKLG